MLLLKILGSGLIIAATTAIGLMVAANYSRRPAELRLVAAGLELLETQIGYAATPLPTALSTAAASLRGPVAGLFRLTARALDRGRGFTADEAWQMSLGRIWSGTAMNNPDREILRALGPHLGVSDRDDQVKHLALARQRLQSSCAEADTAAVKESRLWRSLGALAGVAVVLLLI